MTVFETLKAMREANPQAECRIELQSHGAIMRWQWQIVTGAIREYRVIILEEVFINSDLGYIAAEIQRAKRTMELAE